MMRTMAIRSLLIALAWAATTTTASAQVFGTFTWQMQPYCNRVTLTLTSVTGNFTLDGSDDMCGGAKKASATGIGVFNPDGTVGINFTIVPPSGPSVHVSASVSPANGQGTWSDDRGNSGTFAFFGNTAGLPPRPLPTPIAVSGQVFVGHVAARFTPGFSNFDADSVTFPQPLPSTVPNLVVEYVASGTTANCPGHGQSSPGRLCVYNYNSSNMYIDTALASSSSTRFYGAGLIPRATDQSQPGYIFATWAYRVP